MDVVKYEVAVDNLRWNCDTNLLKLACTKDLTPLEDFIGQDRAINAVKFGLEMNRPGYNIYVAGLTGTGKTSVVKTYIKRLISEREEREGAYHPDDWCYVYNFNDPDRPQLVRLPQGKGRAFNNQMTILLQRLQDELGKAFSSEEYETERKKIIEEGQKEQRHIFEKLAKEAQSQGFLFQISSMGPLLLPMANGKPIDQNEYLSLKDEERKVIDERRSQLMKVMETSLEKVRELETNTLESLNQRDRKIGERAIHTLFQKLLGDYRQFGDVDNYLKGLEAYALDNLDFFKQQETASQTIGLTERSTITTLRPRTPAFETWLQEFKTRSCQAKPRELWSIWPTAR